MDLELQKIDSFANKSLTPQEKDWFLNNEVLKFLKQRSSSLSNSKTTGFENTTKRLDDVKDFIKPFKLIKDNQENTFLLPPDYFSYIRVDFSMYKDCSNIRVKKTENTIYKSTINIKPDVDVLNIFKINIVINSIETTIFDIEDLPSEYLITTDSKKQEFLLRKAIKIKIKEALEKISPNTYIYWDNFNKYKITFIANFNFSINTNINTKINIGIPSSYIISETKGASLKARSRAIDHEFFTDVENSALSGSKDYSPICNIIGKTLKVSPPKGVIIESVVMTYICYPSIIDLLLNSDLNTDYDTSIEIVSNTIRFIKSIIDKPNYEAYLRENTLIE